MSTEDGHEVSSFRLAGSQGPGLGRRVSLKVHNPALQSNPNGFGAPTRAQLLEYVTDVNFHRALSNAERHPDFFVRLASHH